MELAKTPFNELLVTLLVLVIITSGRVESSTQISLVRDCNGYDINIRNKSLSRFHLRTSDLATRDKSLSRFHLRASERSLLLVTLLQMF
jgi:hypothetical protein